MQIRKLQRSKEPNFQEINKLQILLPKQIATTSGIPVYIFPIEEQEIVKIDFVINAGDSAANQVLTPYSTLMMLQEGSQNFLGEEIAERMDFLGAYVHFGSNKDNVLISVCCLEKHLIEVMQIVFDFLLRPTFPQDKLNTHLLKRKERYKIDSERVEVIAQRTLLQQLYGADHPYGRIIQLDDFETVTPEKLIKFHKDNYRPDKCKIIICGNPKSNDVQNLIGIIKDFKFEREKPSTQVSDINIHSNSQLKHYITKENAVQSSLNIGKIMVNRQHPDYVGLQILNTVFGGYFGSRLMSNVREEKGFTYGIGSGIISLKHSGYFVISSHVGKNVVPQALEAIYYEMKRLRNEPISNDELKMVKTYMRSTMVRNFDGAFATSEMLREIVDSSMDFNTYYQTFWKTINNIQPKELQQLANVYFNENSMYEIVAG